MCTHSGIELVVVFVLLVKELDVFLSKGVVVLDVACVLTEVCGSVPFTGDESLSRNTLSFVCLACLTVLLLAAGASVDVRCRKRSCSSVLGRSVVFFSFKSLRLKRSIILSNLYVFRKIVRQTIVSNY